MRRRAHTDIINIANNGSTGRCVVPFLLHKQSSENESLCMRGGQLMLACQAKHEAAPVIVLMIGKTDKVKCIMKQELTPPE